MTNNPYNKGDRVSIKRGPGRLNGTVERTKLATVFIRLDDNERIVQERYNDCGDVVAVREEKEIEDGTD